MIVFKNDCLGPVWCDGFWDELKTRSYHRPNYDESSEKQCVLKRVRGITEGFQTMRIYTMHSCTEIDTAMSEFTKSHCLTSEEQKVMGQIIVHWFSVHNPFNENQVKLNFWSFVLTLDANCDKAKEIWLKIQQEVFVSQDKKL